MSEQDIRSATGYADAALNLLRRGSLPPTPQFYELLYTYATGVNPTLNERVNAMYRDGGASAAIAAQLYDAFIKSGEDDSRLMNASEQVSQRIEAVTDAIDSAMATANAFSSEIQHAFHELSQPTAPQIAARRAQKLLDHAQRMQQSNAALEAKLASSRQELAGFQRELEEVKREKPHDPLTRIGSRKTFDNALQKAIEDAQIMRRPLSVLMIDVDFFKRFNETWGYQVGDQVLRLVAATIESNVKGRDIAARMGGDKFVVILPDTEIYGAAVVAENLRHAIQARELMKRSTSERLGRITVSIGVASYRIGETGAEYMNRAVLGARSAKASGRNCAKSDKDLISLATDAA